MFKTVCPECVKNVIINWKKCKTLDIINGKEQFTYIRKFSFPCPYCSYNIVEELTFNPPKPPSYESIENLHILTTTYGGWNKQLSHITEECGEFIAKLNQHRRGRVADYELVEEATDVFITVTQVRAWFPELWNILLQKKICKGLKACEKSMSMYNE